MSGSHVFGQTARDLVYDLYRSKELIAYNDEAVRRIVEEIKALDGDVQNTIAAQQRQQENSDQPDNALVAGVVAQHASAQRNKRLVLAYINERMSRIEALRWYYGAVVPEGHRSKMSNHEHDYLKGYSDLLNRYMRTVGIDLTADLSPPKHLYTHVVVQEDCGEIMTYRGSVKLERGAVLSLRRPDVEHLIRQGKLREIDHEN